MLEGYLFCSSSGGNWLQKTWFGFVIFYLVQMYHHGVVFIKFWLICHFEKGYSSWFSTLDYKWNPHICLLDWCYKHDTCYVLSSHQMQWIMLTSADPALVKHFKYQWCEGVYIYFDLNDLYWFYLERYDLKASKLRHIIFASLSPTSLTTSYLCWKC